MQILIGAVIFALGILIGRFLKPGKKIGRFVINDNDPTKPAFWLALDFDLDVIEKQREVILGITRHTSSNRTETS